ncbi:fructose-bisphosphate aldolase class I [Streptomyces sp. NBC_00441]|uniref:class I fructose-bisphosphate aldolase n=1 Tax=Streptomyces sp. NBC_00441 TaxID=2975742 RepID=UPI002E2B454E|nr:class I fructose-bisphosphate aldolase [Streptomyces sp. NBC_00441]
MTGHRQGIREIARALAAAGKGILAADDSVGNLDGRFAAHGLPCVPETRRAYREMLLTAPGLAEFVSGVILHEETVGQQDREGVPLIVRVATAGMLPGLKITPGPVEPASLTDWLTAAQERGVRFAKWHAVYEASGTGSLDHDEQPARLAAFARCCQAAGIVPMVESDVLMRGAHTAEDCGRVTTRVLSAAFAELDSAGVDMGGTILKTNMAVPGTDCPRRATAEEVATRTLDALKAAVPPAVPVVTFLSGGLAPVPATGLLDTLNRTGPHPWALTFSYGRALQAPALAAWAGSPEDVRPAQKELLHRARANSEACRGTWRAEAGWSGTAL